MWILRPGYALGLTCAAVFCIVGGSGCCCTGPGSVPFAPEHFVAPTSTEEYRHSLLRSEDFRNDAKDAGDLGSGHTCTAIYEIVPVGVE